MNKDKKLIEKIANDVQQEYQMGGFDGIYFDFACDVALKYHKQKSSLEDRSHYITLLIWLMNELEDEKLITPTQKHEIKKHLSKKYDEL